MYSPTCRLLSLVGLVAAHLMLLPHVDGEEESSSYINWLSCLNYTFPDTETIREFCFVEGGSTSSCTNVTYFSVDFYFQRHNESNSTLGTHTGLLIHVAWEDEGGSPCQVLLNGQSCSSCTTCSSNATAPSDSPFPQVFSADCTNLDQGRNVTCEPVEPLFFPLLSNYSDLVGPMVMTPTFAPTIDSTFKPTIPESVVAPPLAPMTSSPDRSPAVPASKPEPTSASACVVCLFNSFVTALLLLVVGGCIY
jgi:hypothetical protein